MWLGVSSQLYRWSLWNMRTSTRVGSETLLWNGGVQGENWSPWTGPRMTAFRVNL